MDSFFVSAIYRKAMMAVVMSACAFAGRMTRPLRQNSRYRKRQTEKHLSFSVPATERLYSPVLYRQIAGLETYL